MLGSSSIKILVPPRFDGGYERDLTLYSSGIRIVFCQTVPVF